MVTPEKQGMAMSGAEGGLVQGQFCGAALISSTLQWL
jgi:hypothetical protein